MTHDPLHIALVDVRVRDGTRTEEGAAVAGTGHLRQVGLADKIAGENVRKKEREA